MTIGSISFDHPDPSHLHRAHLAQRHAGHGQLRLRDLPAALAGGRGHLPPALVPPQPHERVHGPGARPVRRQARRLQARRREPAQLHGAARPGRRGLRHGQSAPTLAPHKLDDTLAFMFESRWRFHPTALAHARRRARRATTPTAGPACRTTSHHEHARSTHTTPHCAAGSHRPTSRTATSRSRTCPSARFRRAGSDEPLRIGVAIGDQVLDLKLARAQCPWGAGIDELLGAAGRGRPERLDGGRAGGAAQRCAARCRRRWPTAATRRRSWSCAWCRRPRCEMALPCAHRRLHRLLHRHPPCHRGGQAVPARQPAAAQLQVGADRLPRPRVEHRRQPRRPSCGRRGRRCRPVPTTPTLRPLPAAGLRAGTGRLRRRRQRAGPADGHGAGRGRTGSASCCSTTGRRATSRPGNTSRWAPSWRRTSPPPSRPGSSRSRRWRRSARPSTRPAGDPQPLPYLDCARQPRRAARSTSRWRCCCRPQPCASRGLPPQRAEPLELPRCVLERGADAGPPQQRRLQPADRRPAGHRHPVGPAAGAGRLAAGAVDGRQAAADAARRRDAAASCRTATR